MQLIARDEEICREMKCVCAGCPPPCRPSSALRECRQACQLTTDYKRPKAPMFQQVKRPKFKLPGRRCNRQTVACGLHTLVLQATQGRCNKNVLFQEFFNSRKVLQIRCREGINCKCHMQLLLLLLPNELCFNVLLTGLNQKNMYVVTFTCSSYDIHHYHQGSSYIHIPQLSFFGLLDYL